MDSNRGFWQILQVPIRMVGGGRPWTVDDLGALADDENRYEWLPIPNPALEMTDG